MTCASSCVSKGCSHHRPSSLAGGLVVRVDTAALPRPKEKRKRVRTRPLPYCCISNKHPSIHPSSKRLHLLPMSSVVCYSLMGCIVSSSKRTLLPGLHHLCRPLPPHVLHCGNTALVMPYMPTPAGPSGEARRQQSRQHDGAHPGVPPTWQHESSPPPPPPSVCMMAGAAGAHHAPY